LAKEKRSKRSFAALAESFGEKVGEKKGVWIEEATPKKTYFNSFLSLGII
jgi:hypothetical protein